MSETVRSVFLQCRRVQCVLRLLNGLCDKLGVDFFVSGLIIRSVYCARRKSMAVLVNFLFVQAQLAIWFTRDERLWYD